MPMAAAIARAGGPSRAAVGVGARLVRVGRGVGTASRWRLDSNASRPGSESGTAGRARMCRPSVDRRGERPDSDSGPSSVRHEDPPSAAGAARADSARPAQGRMRSGGARARSARWCHFCGWVDRKGVGTASEGSAVQYYPTPTTLETDRISQTVQGG